MSKIRIFHMGGDDSLIRIADSLGNLYAPLEASGDGQSNYLDVDLSGGVQLTVQVVPKPIEFKEAEPAIAIDQTERTELEIAEANAAAAQAASNAEHQGNVESIRATKQTEETRLRDADYEEDERPRIAEE